MKKFLNLIVLLLAVNFVAAAGAVAWLFKSGHLSRERMAKIREIAFPSPAKGAPEVSVAQVATTQPTFNLEDLLARHSGKPAAEQLEYIRQSFDAQMAKLDRAQRSLQDLQRQVLAGQKQLAEDRAAFEAERRKFAEQRRQANKQSVDGGFQSSLAMYESLPPKTVKNIFMGLEDDVVIRYLQGMESRNAARVMKEFKSAPETERLKKLMERMRLSQVSIKE